MAGDVHELDLKTEAKGYGGRHNLRLGADYDFGKKNLLSVVYNTQYRYGQDCTKMRGTAHSDKTDDGDRQLHNVAAIINLLSAFRQEWISFFSPVRHRPFWRKICRMSAGH